MTRNSSGNGIEVTRNPMWETLVGQYPRGMTWPARKDGFVLFRISRRKFKLERFRTPAYYDETFVD